MSARSTINVLKRSPDNVTSRHCQTSSEMMRDGTVMSNAGEVSSGNFNIKREERSGGFSTVPYRITSPQRPRSTQTSSEMMKKNPSVGGPESQQPVFYLCRRQTTGIVQLNIPLIYLNREKRRLEQSRLAPRVVYLRPGMVLLKSFISHDDQVTIINSCHNLGVGKGGFYRPGYKDGAELKLKMMCLGRDWDPESGDYTYARKSDGARPPEIPASFKKLVNEAMGAAQQFLREHKKKSEVENVLPAMTPDVCIVNFYTKNGKLGLHQDKDETQESIDKRLPVVSFSVGDSAEFLYGEKRDADTAEKLLLESGDVLIFGGMSRLLFHGVSSIKPNTAPQSLLNATGLMPGRLNLTFRQYAL